MEKKKRIYFTGKGPFSKINKLTTRISNIEAAKKYGLGRDALMHSIDSSEDSDFVDGVVNYDKIATDPNYGREE
jgi:hypothetical protein